jgi:hypothetical protein
LGAAQKSGYKDFDRVNLQVMKDQRDPGYSKKTRRSKKNGAGR